MSGSHRMHRRIAPDVKLGKNVRIYDFNNLYGCDTGATWKLEPLWKFLCLPRVILEDDVFIGHNVTFINDRYPRATNCAGQLQTESDWNCIGALIEHGASIGSGATLLCGITVGENALAGVGSVAAKDVPPGAVVAGNPARAIKLSSTKS